jgi:hypothetical protein
VNGPLVHGLHRRQVIRALVAACGWTAAGAWAQGAAPQPAAEPPPTARPPGRLLTPGPFDSIEIEGSALVNFLQGSEDQVFVEGDESAQRAVALGLSNGRLAIRPSGSWKFWSDRRAQLTVTARDLKKLTISGAAEFQANQPVQLSRLAVGISGAGQARFDHLQAEALHFSVSGAGNGRFAGQVDQLTVSISGRSDFDGEQLHSLRGRVAISGIGDVKVWAVDELAVSVSGVGTVDYWGSPRLRRSTSGMATINPRGAR